MVKYKSSPLFGNKRYHFNMQANKYMLEGRSICRQAMHRVELHLSLPT